MLRAGSPTADPRVWTWLAMNGQDRTSRADPDGSWMGVRTIYRRRHGGWVMVDVSARTCVGAEGEYFGLEGTTRSLGPGTIQDRSADEAWRRVETVLEERLLSTAFQPIWSLKSGQVIGVEALTRFLISPDSPDAHFSAADSVGLGAELEILALETALDAARDLPDHLYVAVNLSPDACLDPRLPRILSRSELPGRRIVLEVTERHAVEEYGPLRGRWNPCAAPDCVSPSMMPAPGLPPCGTFSSSRLTS